MNDAWQNDPAWVDVIGNSGLDAETAARMRADTLRRSEAYLRERYGDRWREHSPYPEHKRDPDADPR